jgi:hypothetical protein
MSITVAKSAGFCFGVSRAVELVEKCAAEGKTVVTLGPIIHNRHAVDRFRQMGVQVIGSPEEAQPGSTVIIRSHGVTKAVQEALQVFLSPSSRIITFLFSFRLPAASSFTVSSSLSLTRSALRQALKRERTSPARAVPLRHSAARFPA